MKKQKRRYLLLLISAAISCWVLFYLFSSVYTAAPLFQLSLHSKGCPIDAVHPGQHPIRGPQLAAVAADRQGNFYLIAEKKDVLHVLIVEASGRIKGLIPLRRQDARLVRYYCDFLSVSPSGNRWWIARKPFEDSPPVKEWVRMNYLIALHDRSGRCLQEWRLPSEIVELQSVGEDKAYVISVDDQIRVYRRGDEQPQKFHYRVSQPLVTPRGKIVEVGPLSYLLRKGGQARTGHSDEPDNWCGASMRQLGESSQLVGKFQISNDERGCGVPFWYEEGDLFLFRHLKDKNGFVRSDGGKSVLRFTSVGDAHKLFDTPTVLQVEKGKQIRGGQLLKADKENTVWMELGYFGGRKLKGYQIIKIQLKPRWQSWWRRWVK